MTGRPIGTEIARHVDPPKATVVVDPKGGSFCGTMTAYRYPEMVAGLLDSEIDALTGPHAGVLADLDQHGATNCPKWNGK